jgi:pimeloyl-ACP methyl ester carboxylesterase
VSGPRLILVHGAVERASSFDEVVPLLSGYDVVAFERAGHGTRWEEGPGTVAGDVRDLVAAIGEEPATLVGHSIGGLAVIGAALEVPDLVRGIGLYETALPWADWWTDDGRDAMRRETEDNVAAAGRIDPSNPARARVQMAWATCLQEVLDAFGAPFPWQDLTVPITTGYGSEGARPSARDAALVAAYYGVEPVVLQGAGHRAPKTHPEAFARFVRCSDQHVQG